MATTIPAKPPSSARERGRGPIALSVGLEWGFVVDVAGSALRSDSPVGGHR